MSSRRQRQRRQRRVAAHNEGHDSSRPQPEVVDPSRWRKALTKRWVRYLLIGAVIGLVAGVVAGGWLVGMGAGALGGATLAWRDDLAPRLGRWTATCAVGLVWAMVITILASHARHGLTLTEMGVWAFLGFSAPWLFVLASLPLKWGWTIVHAAGRRVRPARLVERREELRMRQGLLFTRPWHQDPTAWISAVGLVGALVVVLVAGSSSGVLLLAAVIAAVGPASASVRMSRRVQPAPVTKKAKGANKAKARAKSTPKSQSAK